MAHPGWQSGWQARAWRRGPSRVLRLALRAGRRIHHYHRDATADSDGNPARAPGRGSMTAVAQPCDSG